MNFSASRRRSFASIFAADASATGAWQADNLYLANTQVERGLIRVDADEVTYPLHVILRYELEQALMSGDLVRGRLPAAWDEKMRHYLGRITKDDFRDGCMQDVHWFAGLFGYFPSYTMGAVIAAQLFAAVRRNRARRGGSARARRLRASARLVAHERARARASRRPPISC